MMALLVGVGSVAIQVAPAAAAAKPTLKMSTTATGVVCHNTNLQLPWCTKLANGDVMALKGTNYSPGATASSLQCNSDPTQPVIVFLGQNVPVSCSTLTLSTVSSTGTFNADQSLVTGPVGPPLDTGIYPETCDPASQGGTGGKIAGCKTTGDGTTTSDGIADAARFPCPPTKAEIAKGDACVVAIGDTAGDKGVGVVLFGTEKLPNCPAKLAAIPSACTPTIKSATPKSLAPGKSGTVTFAGAGFGSGAKLSFSGPSTKVTVGKLTVAYATIKGTVTVPTGTAAGAYTVTVTNTDGAVGTCKTCFSVS